jgi:hypothetical protein
LNWKAGFFLRPSAKIFLTKSVQAVIIYNT